MANFKDKISSAWPCGHRNLFNHCNPTPQALRWELQGWVTLASISTLINFFWFSESIFRNKNLKLGQIRRSLLRTKLWVHKIDPVYSYYNLFYYSCNVPLEQFFHLLRILNSFEGFFLFFKNVWEKGFKEYSKITQSKCVKSLIGHLHDCPPLEENKNHQKCQHCLVNPLHEYLVHIQTWGGWIFGY